MQADFSYQLILSDVGAACRPHGIEGPIARGYSIFAALLALDDPRRVLYRTREPICLPSARTNSTATNSTRWTSRPRCFPVGALVRSGKLLIYAGAGD